MTVKGKVDWYANDVLLVVDGASDEILTKLAFEVEAVAKPGAPVDIGFMRNAIYTVAPEHNGRQAAEAEARGANPDAAIAPELHIAEHEATVHGAAEYTIYQEQRGGFLYRALEAAQKVAGGIIQEVGRKRFG
jgi:hypothetical protein